MAALALEVNDAGLLVLREGRPRPEAESPGIALFESGEVLTGAAAAGRAYFRPRAVHDAYLDPLDTEPLGRPFPARLRRADLGFAHLTTLLEGLLQPHDEVFLAVPGFWGAQNLGLLLGVAGAAGLRVAGLVDAATAAASLAGGHGPRLHLDLTRHRSVLSALGGNQEVERGRVVHAEGLGTRAFEERMAREIARLFVRETRFDPLYSGATEQALRDALPGWLFELRRLEACPAVLTAGGREHRIELTREALASASEDLHRALADQVKAVGLPAGAQLLASARVSRIPGLVAHLRTATRFDALELPHDITVSAVLRHRERLRHPGPALPFVTRLPTAGAFVAGPVRQGPQPTHLLNAGVAHALGQEELALGTAPPLGVRGLGLRREGVAAHHCSLLREGSEAFLVDHTPGRTFLNDEVVEGRAALRAGDRLRLGDPGVELLLVAIEDAH